MFPLQRPRFTDRLEDERAALVWNLLTWTLAVLGPAAVFATASSPRPLLTLGVFTAISAIPAACLVLLARGHVGLAAWVYPGGLLAAFFAMTFVLGGVGSLHFAGLVPVILIARVSVGPRAGVAALVSALVLLTLGAWLEQSGHLPAPVIPARPVDELVALDLILVFSSAFIHLSSRGFEASVAAERSAAASQKKLAEQASSLAHLGQAALVATEPEPFAAEVVAAVVRTAGAEVATVLSLGAGRGEVIASGGALPGPRISDPATFAALLALARGRPGPVVDRVPGLPPHQIAAPVSGSGAALGLVVAAFSDRAACEHAAAFVETAASLLATTFERDQQRARLVEAQKLDVAGRLAASVGHEFNNLLAGIVGDASAIAEDSTGSPRSLAKGILAAADRAALLTGRLLTVARKQVPKVERSDASIELRRFHGALVRWLPPSIRAELDLAKPPLPVMLDRGEFEQVLHALSSNAVRAMDAGGTLSLRTREVRAEGAAGWAVVEVEDTGDGMTDDVRAHLFEPFFTTHPEGAGLGLFTSRSIVEKHGGELKIESRPGRGTVVRVSWPLEEAPKTGEVPRPRSGHRPFAHGPTRVLVVDDEVFVRKSMARILTRAGYEVLQAEDGVAALELLEHTPGVGLVVTDVLMPKLGGVELAARVRDQHGIPAVLVSGYADNLGDQARSLPFLAKPFQPQALLDAVRGTLSPSAPRTESYDVAAVDDERITQAALHGLLIPEAAAAFRVANAASWTYDLKTRETVGGAGFARLHGFEDTAEWRGTADDILARVVEADRTLALLEHAEVVEHTKRLRIQRTPPYRVRVGATETRWVSSIGVFPRGWRRAFGWSFECAAGADGGDGDLAAALAEADRGRVSTLLSGQISHDLGNYLSVVRGGVSNLATWSGFDAEQREEVADVLEASERCLELTRSLVRLSRGSKGPETFRPAAVVGELGRLLERVVREKARLVLELDPGAGAILGDRAGFERAVTNLVVNARDAIPDGREGRIVVTVAPLDEDQVLVRVVDDGVGMEPHVKAHIFDPFFSTKRDRGTGLGLSSTRMAIEAMNGTISVTSDVGRGSTFSIELPTQSA